MKRRSIEVCLWTVAYFATVAIGNAAIGVAELEYDQSIVGPKEKPLKYESPPSNSELAMRHYRSQYRAVDPALPPMDRVDEVNKIVTDYILDTTEGSLPPALDPFINARRQRGVIAAQGYTATTTGDDYYKLCSSLIMCGSGWPNDDSCTTTVDWYVPGEEFNSCWDCFDEYGLYPLLCTAPSAMAAVWWRPKSDECTSGNPTKQYGKLRICFTDSGVPEFVTDPDPAPDVCPGELSGQIVHCPSVLQACTQEPEDYLPLCEINANLPGWWFND